MTAVAHDATLLLGWELIRPCLAAKWPAVDEQSLEQTEGDRDAVVALVASRTQHTRTLVRRHLDALQAQMAAEEGALVVAEDGAMVLDSDQEEQITELCGTVKKGKLELTEFARKLPGIVKEKLHAKWLISLAASLGVGFVLGLVARSLLLARSRAAAEAKAAAKAEAERPRVSITLTLT